MLLDYYSVENDDFVWTVLDFLEEEMFTLLII